MPVQITGASHNAFAFPQRRMAPQAIAANRPIQNAQTSHSTTAAGPKIDQKKNNCGAAQRKPVTSPK